MRTALAAGALLVASSWPAPAADPLVLVRLDSLREEVGLLPAIEAPRFLLTSDGEVFVGGSRGVRATRLPARDFKDVERQVEAVRRLPGVQGGVTFGPGPGRFRLSIGKGPVEIVTTGDPAQAPPALAPLAVLVRRLSAYWHPLLRPYAPAQYRVQAVETRLPGGCRDWDLPVPLAAALAAPALVPASAVMGSEWPTGGAPASVCAQGRRFAVGFRPVLPGDQ